MSPFKMVLLAGVLVTSQQAAAADLVIEPQKTTEPVSRTFPGRNVDIVGLSSGMTLQEVTAKLKADMPDASIRTNMLTVGLNYKGATVKFQQYTGGLLVNGGDANGLISLFFGSPASGNQLTSLLRNVDYRDPFKAPTREDVVAALTAKYGKPSGQSQSEKLMTLTWLVKDAGDYVCPVDPGRKVPMCPVTVASNRDSPDVAERAMKAGFKVGISALLYTKADSNKLTSLVVTIEDYENTVVATNAADTQLKEAVDKQFSNSSSAKPKL
ncbi:hypothetical protein [Oleisolibacter albus]|uniref:hypothetical protein n=1 Tax=Oleisolibacter albus TaxID=2171757 RepID=UPI0012D810E6|nr:hypothetical protein [Oleisolibacter albus]